jgi:hypothetical protein
MSSDIVSLTANSRDNGDMSNKKEVRVYSPGWVTPARGKDSTLA